MTKSRFTFKKNLNDNFGYWLDTSNNKVIKNAILKNSDGTYTHLKDNGTATRYNPNNLNYSDVVQQTGSSKSYYAMKHGMLYDPASKEWVKDTNQTAEQRKKQGQQQKQKFDAFINKDDKARQERLKKNFTAKRFQTEEQKQKATQKANTLIKTADWIADKGVKTMATVATAPTLLGSGLVKAAAQLAAPIATEYGADKLAGNHTENIQVLGNDNQLYNIEGTLDKNGNYIGDYIGQNLTNDKGEKVTIQSVLQNGRELNKSESIFNNKYARMAADALAVTAAHGLTNPGTYKTFFSNSKNSILSNPTSAPLSSSTSLSLGAKANLGALGQTSKELGKNYLGNLAVFGGFHAGEKIAPDNAFVQGALGTAAGLLTRRFTNKTPLTILGSTGQMLGSGATYAGLNLANEEVSKVDPEAAQYITPALQLASMKYPYFGVNKLGQIEYIQENVTPKVKPIWDRGRYIALSQTGGNPNATGFKNAFQFFTKGIDQANTSFSRKNNPHKFSRKNAAKYIWTGDDKYINGLTGYFGYSDSPYPFQHKYNAGEITPLGLTLGINKLPEANSNGYYDKPIKVLGGYAIGDKRIFSSMDPSFTEYANTRWKDSQVPVIVNNEATANKTIDLLKTGRHVNTFGDPQKKLAAENRNQMTVQLDDVYRQQLQERLDYLNSLPEASTPQGRRIRNEEIKKINRQLNENVMFIEPRTYNTGGIQQHIIERNGKYYTVDWDNFKHAPDELNNRYDIFKGPKSILSSIGKQLKFELTAPLLKEETSAIVLGGNRKTDLFDYMKANGQERLGADAEPIKQQVLNDPRVWGQSKEISEPQIEKYILKKTGLGEKKNGHWQVKGKHEFKHPKKVNPIKAFIYKKLGKELPKQESEYELNKKKVNDLKDQILALKENSSINLKELDLAKRYQQYLLTGSTSHLGTDTPEAGKLAYNNMLANHPNALHSNRASFSKFALNNLTIDKNYTPEDVEKVSSIILGNAKTLNPLSETSKNEWNNLVKSIRSGKTSNNPLLKNIKGQLKENYPQFLEELKFAIENSPEMKRIEESKYIRTKRAIYGQEGKIKELFNGKSDLKKTFRKSDIDALKRRTKFKPLSKELWAKLSDRAKKQLETGGVKHLQKGGELTQFLQEENLI